MATRKLNLPPGFELDAVAQNLPEGFELDGQGATPTPTMFGKAWNALKVPEQKSREGLQMMAQMVAPKTEVTGNLARDVAMNLPKIGMETLAETAPSFISRESIITAGGLKTIKALKPVIKAVGRGAAKAAESISGLEYKTPGVLKEVARDPKLLIGAGTKKAGELFEKLSDKGRIRPSFARATSSKDLLDDALKAADEGTLTAEEALVARQTLDGIRKTLPRFSFKQMRDTFDAVAKTKSAEADAAFTRAVKSDALRLFLPVNKSGGTSIAKSALGSIAGFVPTAAMSPVVQGTVAAGAGMASRAAAPLINSPVKTAAAVQVAKIVKTLTEEKAREYLKNVKKTHRNLSDAEQREKARQMALMEGWEIPE